MSGPASVHDLVQSHRITAVIYAAAKLNLAEAIGDEAKSVAELARLVSADENALRRLLVGLTTLGLCRQADRDRFAMTELGRQLDETADPSFKDWVLFEGEMLAQSWIGLVEFGSLGQERGRAARRWRRSLCRDEQCAGIHPPLQRCDGQPDAEHRSKDRCGPRLRDRARRHGYRRRHRRIDRRRAPAQPAS